MSDERILEIIENQDKYYILGFIKGFKANTDILKQEKEDLKKKLNEATHKATEFESETYELKEELQKSNDTLDTHNELIEHLKKELEELREQTIIDTLDLQTHKYQQQEFIKYLEDDLKEKYRDMGYRHNLFREILDKYKEIIGSDNNGQ